VGTASRSALSTFESNIRGTWNLLEACRLCPSGIKRIVVASSDKAYGSQFVLPYTEETPLQGRFPYDVSKSCSDLIAQSYYHSYGMPIGITRCGNLFGGGDLNFSRLVPGTIRSALQDKPPVIRSDGAYIREYFYVRDAVEAYLTLAEQLSDDRLWGQAFNFGNERPISVRDLVQDILAAAGRTDLEPIVLNEASREIREQYLDCSKARSQLGWEPRYSLQEALLETVDWYKHWFAVSHNGAAHECQESLVPIDSH
jgi:CDP-glucose 4,6-dehydratase